MDDQQAATGTRQGAAVQGRRCWAQPLDWVLLGIVVIVCEALVWKFLPNGSHGIWTSREMKAALAALVGFPVVLSFASLCLALVRDPHCWRYELSIPDSSNVHDAGWANALTFVSESWSYEQERFSRSIPRVGPSALLFGEIATLLLTAAVLVAAWGQQLVAPHLALAIGISLATAVGAAFVGQFVRILVRIAGQDFNARMFAWASRSVVLVAIADAGLLIALQKANVPQWIVTYGGAVLLGLFTAVLGDRAIDVMLSKTGGVFGFSAPKPAAASSLTNLDGITDEDVDRFAEERVLTIFDVAFAPTARLFFNTTHSLQRICDWQDQALLLAYMGPARTKALFEQLGVRGAIDLQALAALVLPVCKTPEDDLVTVPSASTPKYSQLRAVLSKALGAEGAALMALLYTVNSDEVILRLRIHWKGTTQLV